MDRQATYTAVRDHLLRQGKRSWNDIDGCLYRTDDGMRCAVGCLIPDDIYDSKMEGQTVTELLSNFPQVCSALDADEFDVQFLTALQHIHDRRLTVDWASELKRVALLWGLDP